VTKWLRLSLKVDECKPLTNTLCVVCPTPRHGGGANVHHVGDRHQHGRVIDQRDLNIPRGNHGRDHSIRVHSLRNIRTNPGTWKVGVFWKRTYAEIAQNRTKPHKIDGNRLVRSPELPKQRGCVPGSEYYLKSALVVYQVVFLDLTGAMAKAWCLLIHVEASLALSRSIVQIKRMVDWYVVGSSTW